LARIRWLRRDFRQVKVASRACFESDTPPPTFIPDCVLTSYFVSFRHTYRSRTEIVRCQTVRGSSFSPFSPIRSPGRACRSLATGFASSHYVLPNFDSGFEILAHKGLQGEIENPPVSLSHAGGFFFVPSRVPGLPDRCELSFISIKVQGGL
jgi:hypothetical protein